MKKLSISIPALLLIFFLSSCYYDKEDLLYGNNTIPCTDTSATASYATQVVPVLTQYCYNCHTGSFPSGGIIMGGYTADKALAQNGKLYGSIIHAAGYSPMPKGMSKLNNCHIARIRKWIDNGMLNN